jgi:triosephosphate isomerase (TIM)
MQQKKMLIAANWKMHKNISDAVSFVTALQNELDSHEDREVMIAPSYVALPSVRKAMNREGFKLAAQNCHWDDRGAYTGEVSCDMLKDVGCELVIIGHSERRHIFGEDDGLIRNKVGAAFKYGLVPVVCIGEVLQEREDGRTFRVVEDQLKQAVAGLSHEQARQLVVAYEPVWAIGTGKTATPDQAQEVHSFIREKYATLFDKDIANTLRILYGGSVKPDNVDALMAQPDIDGLLVGGASLEIASFKRIVQYQITGGKIN